MQPICGGDEAIRVTVYIVLQITLVGITCGIDFMGERILNQSSLPVDEYP
jgi:hypothetical protein